MNVLGWCLVISASFSVVYARDTCKKDDDVTYESCSHGCCFEGTDNPCCLSPYLIASIVLASLAATCLIVVLIFCVVKRKTQGRKTVNPARAYTANSHLFRFNYPVVSPQKEKEKSLSLEPDLHGVESWLQTYWSTSRSRRASFVDSTIVPPVLDKGGRRASMASVGAAQRQLRVSSLQPASYTVNRWSARRPSAIWSNRRASMTSLHTRRASMTSLHPRRASTTGLQTRRASTTGLQTRRASMTSLHTRRLSSIGNPQLLRKSSMSGILENSTA